MKFYSPGCRSQQWFLTLFFRERGRKNLVKVGSNVVEYGRGRDHTNRLSIAQIEWKDEPYAVELFPGSRLLAVVCSPEPQIDRNFAGSLCPADEVELVKPSEIVEISDPKLAEEITAKGEDSVKRDLEVLNGSRKRIYG